MERKEEGKSRSPNESKNVRYRVDVYIVYLFSIFLISMRQLARRKTCATCATSRSYRPPSRRIPSLFDIFSRREKKKVLLSQFFRKLREMAGEQILR